MKKFLQELLLYICFSIVLYTAGIFVVGSCVPDWLRPNLKYRLGSYGHTFTRLKEADQCQVVDILFLGSSHAYRGFDPRIFSSCGYSSFNLGTSAQNHTVTQSIIGKYIKRMQPRLCIYEVYPETFGFDGVESAIDIVSNTSLDENILKMCIDVNNTKVYNTLLFSGLKNLLGAREGFIENPVSGKSVYVHAGFVETDTLGMRFDEIAPQVQPSAKQFEAFDENIQNLESQGVRTVLVIAPLSKRVLENYGNLSAFKNQLATNAKLIDMSDYFVGRDSLYFIDKDHLNQSGVNLFNRSLIDSLVVYGILENGNHEN